MRKMKLSFIAFELLAVIFSVKANIGTASQTWSSWIRCENEPDICQWKRERSCIHQDNPYQACGEEKGWLERYRSCLSCNSPGVWYFKSATSCEGSRCDEKRQNVLYGCSDHLGQPNCEKVVTKFCDLSNTCDGNWGSWEVASRCDPSQSSLESWETKTRTCYKNNTTSGDCKKENDVLTDSQQTRCDAFTTTTSIALPSKRSTLLSSTTVLSSNGVSESKGSQENNPKKGLQSGKTFDYSSTSNSSDSEKEPNLLKYDSCFWWSEKTYILIIQSIIIVFLCGIIVYLLRLRSKQKRKEKAIAAVELPLRSPALLYTRSPSLNYNRLSTAINFYKPPDDNDEYTHMLSDHRLSLPNFQRPLPEHPSVRGRPVKPPRLSRAALQRQTLPTPSPAQNGQFLNAPAPPQYLSHSVPSSPTTRNQSNTSNFYSSIGNVYLSPLN